jgi:hypothetical protein
MALDPGAGDGAALAAALIRLADHARLLRGLGTGHDTDDEPAAALNALADAVTDVLDDYAGILNGLSDRDIAGLAARLGRADPHGAASAPGGYEPGPQRRFWQLTGQARDEAAARLRGWVDEVYRPGYGHLAAGLGDCWDAHPLCLYTLDWLSELWAVLYLGPDRTPDTLAGQAEWQTRLLTAAADQMARETTRCAQHRTAPATTRQLRGTP